MKNRQLRGNAAGTTGRTPPREANCVPFVASIDNGYRGETCATYADEEQSDFFEEEEEVSERNQTLTFPIYHTSLTESICEGGRKASAALPNYL